MATSSADWVGLELAGGRYQVTDKLGEGGMGLVFRAWDRNLETDVVIKVPRRSMLEDERFAGRFAREIRSMVQLSHPHIVKVLDVGEHDGLAFAVMQYLSGGTLRDRYSGDVEDSTRAIRPEELFAWLEDVADALDYIHTKGYVHRDVKPENILLDESGHVCLSDFGIAKIVAESKTMLTSTGAVVGTPHYMSPEQLQEKPYDGRVDQYALAIMTFELLAGRRPFEGPSAVVIALHMTQPPPVLHEVAHGIPPALSACVAKALAKDPEERYPTCKAFAQAVLAVLQPGAAQENQTVKPRAQAASAGAATTPTAAPGSAAVVCPGCGKRLTIRGSTAGRRLRCPSCQEVFQPPRTQLTGSPTRTEGGAEPSTAPVSSRAETQLPHPKTVIESRSPAKAKTEMRAVERRPRSRWPLAAGLCLAGIAGAAALYFGLVHRTQPPATLAAATSPKAAPTTLPETQLTAVQPTAKTPPPQTLSFRLLNVQPVSLTAGGKSQTVRYQLERRGMQRQAVELQLSELPKGVQVNQGKSVVLGPTDTEFALEWQAEAAAPAQPVAAAKLAARLDGEAVAIAPHGLPVSVRQPQLRLEAVAGALTIAAGDAQQLPVRLERDGYVGVVTLTLKGPAGNKLVSAGMKLAADATQGELAVTAAADAEGDLEAVIEAARAAGPPAASVKVKVRVVNAGAALKRGDEHLKQHRYAKAVEEYGAVVDAAPQSAAGHLGRAKALLALHDYRQARVDCTEALKLDRNDRTPNLLLGQIALAEDAWDKAQEYYLLALDDKRPDAEIYAQRGWARFLSGSVDKALEDYKKALALDPKHALAHANLGLALATQQKYEDALAATARAIELDPKLARAQRQRGEVYRLLAGDPLAKPRDPKPGLEAYGKALELDPKDYYSLVGRAKTNFLLGASKKATDDLLPAIKLNRDAVKTAPVARVTQRLNAECADMYLYVGKAQAVQGYHDKAVGEFALALETCSRFDDKPLRTQVHEDRGLSYLQLKQYDKAVEDFDEAIQLNRNSARAHAFKGYALHLLRQNDKAKTLCSDAIILSNQQWGWPYLARSLANRGIGLLKDEEADRLKAKQLGCTTLFPVR